jgi:hypothetical protein
VEDVAGLSGAFAPQLRHIRAIEAFCRRVVSLAVAQMR